jgi:hypothetical protein
MSLSRNTIATFWSGRWAHDAYQQARARGQHHNRALPGVGARWVRILWRCWTDRVRYDPARHLNTTPTRAS